MSVWDTIPLNLGGSSTAGSSAQLKSSYPQYQSIPEQYNVATGTYNVPIISSAVSTSNRGSTSGGGSNNSGLDPHINPATGVWDDNYFANLNKGSGDGGGGDVNSILNGYISSLSGLFPKQVKPYEQVNPFSFDEALARQASTAEYDPYYQQMLTDYTSSVERTKSRSQEDLKSTLEQLQSSKDYYTGASRRALDAALKSTNEGYAGRGLFFSGAKEKDIGLIKEEYGAQTGQYESQYKYNVGQANLGVQRQTQDIGTAEQQYTRNVGQAEKAAIEQGVLQRKGEAISQYEAGRQKYYQGAQYGGIA